MLHGKTSYAAKGKWRGILMALGMAETFLKDQHGPCPICGGNDRFRWDNQNGRGTYICGQCGAGDGMKLAMEYTGMSFSEIAPKIDGLLGNLKPESGSQRREMTDDERRNMLRAAYSSTQPIGKGDAADKYLTTRRLDQPTYPAALRFSDAMKDGEGGVRPCMVALVGIHGNTDPKGRQQYCSMHRTFLKPDGSGKAEMASPRKMMPGSLPDGACVMLSEWPGHGAIGVAEGIETAMSASAMFDMPVWAALNATMMEKWFPPAGADEVAIFVDSDANFRGLRAGAILANKLRTNPKYVGLEVNIQTPRIIGTDWADEWTADVRAVSEA